MNKIEDLRFAYSELGAAAANLSFAGYFRLSTRVRNLQSEVSDLIDCQGDKYEKE